MSENDLEQNSAFFGKKNRSKNFMSCSYLVIFQGFKHDTSDNLHDGLLLISRLYKHFARQTDRTFLGKSLFLSPFILA